MTVPVDRVPCCVRACNARASSASRFEALYLDHEDELYRYVARRVGPASAEAFIAEVFALAWQRFPERDRSVVPRDWLLGIAVRLLRNHRHDEREHLQRFAATGVDPLAESTPKSRSADDRLASVVAGALAELSDTERDVLTLHLWLGASHESIAEVLGIERWRVAMQVERAVRFVHDRVEHAQGQRDAGSN